MAALDIDEPPPPETRLMVQVGPGREVALVEAAWVNALAAIEERVMAHRVIDAATQQVASDMLRRLTTAGKQLDEAKKTIKAPFLAACRSIDEAERGPALRIEAAKKRLQNGLTGFAQAEEARIRAEEAARQAEIARLEAVARAERQKIEAAAAKAAEEARLVQEAALAAKPVDPLGIEEEEPVPEAPPPEPPAPTQAEIALEQARHAPAPVAAKAAGVAMRVTLDLLKVDAEKLPAPFVQRVPLMALLRSTYCVGWVDGNPIPECPGVTFEVKRVPVSTRQRI